MPKSTKKQSLLISGDVWNKFQKFCKEHNNYITFNDARDASQGMLRLARTFRNDHKCEQWMNC